MGYSSAQSNEIGYSSCQCIKLRYGSVQKIKIGYGSRFVPRGREGSTSHVLRQGIVRLKVIRKGLVR